MKPVSVSFCFALLFMLAGGLALAQEIQTPNQTDQLFKQIEQLLNKLKAEPEAPAKPTLTVVKVVNAPAVKAGEPAVPSAPVKAQVKPKPKPVAADSASPKPQVPPPAPVAPANCVPPFPYERTRIEFYSGSYETWFWPLVAPLCLAVLGLSIKLYLVRRRPEQAQAATSAGQEPSQIFGAPVGGLSAAKEVAKLENQPTPKSTTEPPPISDQAALGKTARARWAADRKQSPTLGSEIPQFRADLASMVARNLGCKENAYKVFNGAAANVYMQKSAFPLNVTAIVLPVEFGLPFLGKCKLLVEKGDYYYDIQLYELPDKKRVVVVFYPQEVQASASA